jgi:hypothetical protein
MKKIEYLKKLAEDMVQETPVICADMELLESEDPNWVVFGYSNGWATTFYEGEIEQTEENIDGTVTKTKVKVIKFCHVYCKNGKPDADSEETKVRFASLPEMALHAGIVECYSRELGMQLGLNI